MLWQAGERDIPPVDLAEPYTLQIAGRWANAAAAWHELGCPYEAAAAMAESDDPEFVQRAIATFEELGAQPALSRVITRLRAVGSGIAPVVRRGPRQSTRSNPAGLTQREAEVLSLVAAGLRNAEIAERLFLTPKTVSHHLSAIYAKLGVDSRIAAAQVAARIGIGLPLN